MKILVTKEEGIGNAIMAVPLLNALRHYIPSARIDVLASPRNYELFKMISCVDNLIPVWELEKVGKYDYVIDTVFGNGVYLQKVKKRCEKVIRANNNYRKYSEARLNLDTLKELGIKLDRNFWAEIDIKREKKENLVCIHVGCFGDDLWETRKWFNDRWAELINRIPKKYKICLIGNLSEIPDNYDIEKKVARLCKNKRLKNLTSIYSLYDTSKLLSSAKVLVSIDSGMVHLACAVGTHSVALYGPTSEIKSQPWVPRDRYSILRIPMKCERCYINNGNLWRKCKNNMCMKAITADMVYKELEGVL